MKPHNPILEFKRVGFFYSNDRVLFKDLDLAFESGSFNLIRGPSGSGKSSLLKLMNRIHDPREGEIRFLGRPLADYQPQTLRTRIIYIQQTPVVSAGSVKDNMLLPFTFKANQALTGPDDARLRNLLDRFYLDQVRLADSALNLSVGQQQRLCLIRGLLLSPAIVLLDEPTSALDEESSRIVESSAVRLCRESGLTVIMVSHKGFDQNDITPRILTLANGKIREDECRPL
jgi:putative ABC transport system ATP-binding protein